VTSKLLSTPSVDRLIVSLNSNDIAEVLAVNVPLLVGTDLIIMGLVLSALSSNGSVGSAKPQAVNEVAIAVVSNRGNEFFNVFIIIEVLFAFWAKLSVIFLLLH